METGEGKLGSTLGLTALLDNKIIAQTLDTFFVLRLQRRWIIEKPEKKF